jgi:hypothetical protein
MESLDNKSLGKPNIKHYTITHQFEGDNGSGATENAVQVNLTLDQ